MEMGFRGNSANYTEDANSFLNDVMDRKLGVPISLGVLHSEVARRLGVTVEPVGFPAHFLTSGFENGDRVFFDCFNGGALLRERDCMRLLTQVSGGAHAFSPAMLAPIGKRSVLLRMLNNLKGIYLQGKLWSMLAQVIELVLVLNPSEASEQRNLGVALVNAGQYRRGLDVISGWLERNPESPDARSMRTYAMELAERVARWN
jgi:regulator of sirC expression with transglutaminase-like and TPR domain